MTPAAKMTEAASARSADASPAFRPGKGRREPPAWILAPPSPAPGARPLVLVHGIARDPERMLGRLADRAAARGRLIVAPFFDARRHRGYQRVLTRTRADRALLTLLDSLTVEGVLAPGPVDLAGYSGGAQFAHRFAWLHPHRVGRLTLAAAGWWTFPDEAPFPYGLGAPRRGDRHAARCLRHNLGAFLDREIVVAVGARDRVPDAATRTGPEIDAQQGRDRLTRARRWVRALVEAAAGRGIDPTIALHVLPGCGHDFAACAEAGLDRLILPDAPPVRSVRPPRPPTQGGRHAQ